MNVFRVGMKVAATQDLECGVNAGEVLTVASIHFGVFRAYDGRQETVGLCFVEKQPRPEYCGFDGRFFRPVVERKTDISVFRAMLNTTPETVGA